MALDKRIVAVLLIAGVFASMVTFALYRELAEPELPNIQSSQTVSGYFSVDVSESEAIEGTVSEVDESNSEGQ